MYRHRPDSAGVGPRGGDDVSAHRAALGIEGHHKSCEDLPQSSRPDPSRLYRRWPRSSSGRDRVCAVPSHRLDASPFAMILAGGIFSNRGCSFSSGFVKGRKDGAGSGLRWSFSASQGPKNQGGRRSEGRGASIRGHQPISVSSPDRITGSSRARLFAVRCFSGKVARTGSICRERRAFVDIRYTCTRSTRTFMYEYPIMMIIPPPRLLPGEEKVNVRWEIIIIDLIWVDARASYARYMYHRDLITTPPRAHGGHGVGRISR